MDDGGTLWMTKELANDWWANTSQLENAVHITLMGIKGTSSIPSCPHEMDSVMAYAHRPSRAT